MERDFILVLGMQGYGKSLWSKLYAQQQPRLLVYCPKRSYSARFLPPEEIVDRVLNQHARRYRLGVDNPQDVDIIGHTAYASGDNLLIVEECSQVFTRGSGIPEWASDLVFTGRHQSTSVIFLAQRPASIPVDIRSQANRVITFRQMEDDDTKWMRKFFGRDAVRDTILRLPMFHCLDYSDRDGVAAYSIRDQARERLKLPIPIDAVNHQ